MGPGMESPCGCSPHRLQNPSVVKNGAKRRALPQPTVGQSAFVSHYRTQLTRQIALLSRVPLWYVTPIALGVALRYADAFLELAQEGQPPLAYVIVGAAALFSLAVFVGVLHINRVAVRKLRRQLDELPTV